MTARELAEQLKIKHVNQIAAALQGCDHFHISGYRRDEDGGRLYPRALYAYGPGKDAKKPPKLGRQEYNRRAKEKMRKTVSSVWDLGIFYEDRRKHALSNVRGVDVCTWNERGKEEARVRESAQVYDSREHHRAECEARFVLSMPKGNRKTYLEGIEKARGKRGREYLEKYIMAEWTKKKPPKRL
jgi:hypothetical protein